MEYFRPTSPEEAVEILAERPDGVPMAGGTDLVVAMRLGKVRPGAIVDLSAAGMDEVDIQDGTVRIGSGVTMSRLASIGSTVPELAVVSQAAEQVGAWQIQARATVGGNIVNASPAADVACALLALEAEVHLLGPRGARSLSLEEFLRGPGQTALEPGEILTAVEVRRLEESGASNQWAATYRKVGNRSAMIIAIASLAARTRLDRDGRVVDVHLALGSVAPTVLRARRTEQALAGRHLDRAAVADAMEAIRDEISPIDDQRASAEYRRDVVGGLLADHLLAASRAAGLDLGGVP